MNLMGLRNMTQHYGFAPLVKIYEEKPSSYDGHLCKMNNTHFYMNEHTCELGPGLATENKSKYNIKTSNSLLAHIYAHCMGPNMN